MEPMVWAKKILHLFLKTKQQGAALIITLLVMMVLVLLALSIVLQSQTEYVISINEQDGMEALSYGESTLDWINRQVIDYVQLTPIAPADLDEILNGPTASPGDDNLPELTGRTLDLGHGLNYLDNSCGTGSPTCERTISVVESFDWDGSGPLPAKTFEAFRIGQDTNGDGNWDGPRAEVYVRLSDDYDNSTTNADDADDSDFRIRAMVMVDYPVFLDESGHRTSETKSPRGRARKMLIGRFAPAGEQAIRTNGDLTISGSLEVCGECGSVHSNGTLEIGGGPAACGGATGSGGIDVTGDPSAIRGGAGITGPVYIPVVNPYDDLYVPVPSVFDRSADTTLPDWLRCPAPGVALDIANDPGATKYYSFMVKKINGQAYMQIWKAYWDASASPQHWIWRLIGDTQTGPLNVQLDNCGRVISGTVSGHALTPDPVPAGIPAWQHTARPDGGDGEFYGFAIPNGSKYGKKGCTSDKSLGGTADNDYTINNFLAIDESGGTPLVFPIDSADYANYDITAHDVGPLPGVAGNNSTKVSNPSPHVDVDLGNANPQDFVIGDCINTGKAEWRNAGGPTDVYSPTWGSVAFIYGNLQLNGGSDISYIDTSGNPASTGLDDINDRWRMTFIVFNTISIMGNPIYGAANADAFPFTMIAGRDIDFHGTAGSDHGNQDQCPSMDAGSDCTAPPGNPAGYEGLYMTHEDLNFHGNATFDGLVIAENAATCSTEDSVPNIATGSVQIHYDCEHPPDPWANRTARLIGWEEVP